MLRDFTGNKAVVCAVGDGSNDIGMLKAANIGISIDNFGQSTSPVEADLKIARFSQLKKLVLWYGSEAFSSN